MSLSRKYFFVSLASAPEVASAPQFPHKFLQCLDVVGFENCEFINKYKIVKESTEKETLILLQMRKFINYTLIYSFIYDLRLVIVKVLHVKAKNNLVSGNRPDEFFLSLTCPHSRICIGIFIFISNNTRLNIHKEKTEMKGE